MSDKKSHIINVAIELFSKNGFEGTSMRDLASAAGVNIAMINYYFGSKEKLFEAIVEGRSEKARKEFEELAQDTSLTAIQKMDRVIVLQVNKVLEKRHFHKVLQNEVMLNKRPELNTAIGNIFKKNGLILRTILEEGIENGEFNEQVDLGLIVSTIMGTINHVFLSRTICNLIFEQDDTGTDPFENPKNKKRVIDHLKALIHVYLQKKQVTDTK
ncbi:DNA-binding transcriptional regulator, AcrR family [Arachidicoccus rhizosphaerae]|uniref:DNA-binding transcriptional regulator, AcrR family n=1 Tax=Arachidicoccus rhizosphaerae TaxID=551991 RepID=A0A1H3Z953_9BACT|nr:TetR/AcrR family transcriptional regulator [Arachidicoccus rhizosphaerae]SEA19891.1 DNA-binding transcriptional regulator, AcrR family [Arachidicoccus rhizosphaerae]